MISIDSTPNPSLKDQAISNISQWETARQNYEGNCQLKTRINKFSLISV